MKLAPESRHSERDLVSWYLTQISGVSDHVKTEPVANRSKLAMSADKLLPGGMIL
jgi:hypothetical protein